MSSFSASAFDKISLPTVEWGCVLLDIPPSQIPTGSPKVWVSILVVGCVVVVVIPFIIYAMRKPSWRSTDAADHFAPFHWETNDKKTRS